MISLFTPYERTWVGAEAFGLIILFCCSKKSKRRAHSDDYYIKQLIENDKQMLRNQQRQLQLDEQVSTATLQFFSVMTAYLNKVNSTMQPPTEPKPPTSEDTTVPSPPGCSKLPSDTEPSPQAWTTQKSDSVAPQTVRQVKRLCTTDISQNPMCNGVTSKVIVLSQEEEIKWLWFECLVNLAMMLLWRGSEMPAHFSFLCFRGN